MNKEWGDVSSIHQDWTDVERIVLLHTTPLQDLITHKQSVEAADLDEGGG